MGHKNKTAAFSLALLDTESIITQQILPQQIQQAKQCTLWILYNKYIIAYIKQYIIRLYNIILEIKSNITSLLIILLKYYVKCSFFTLDIR